MGEIIMIDSITEQILNERLKSGGYKITIECTDQAAEECLIGLLEYIKQNSDPGHSFDIVVDPDMRENKKSFYMDGDGNSYIKSIKAEKFNE